MHGNIEGECWEKLPELDYPSLPMPWWDPGSTCPNRISCPLSPFKLHCKLCLSYSFVLFSFLLQGPSFLSKMFCCEVKNVLTTKSCCGLGKSYSSSANVPSRSPNASFWLSRSMWFTLTLCLSPATSPSTYLPKPFSSHIFSSSSSNIPSSPFFFNVLHLPSPIHARLPLLKVSHISS